MRACKRAWRADMVGIVGEDEASEVGEIVHKDSRFRICEGDRRERE